MYVCVYVCMYVCMHACMHACMYVCNVCMYAYYNTQIIHHIFQMCHRFFIPKSSRLRHFLTFLFSSQPPAWRESFGPASRCRVSRRSEAPWWLSLASLGQIAPLSDVSWFVTPKKTYAYMYTRNFHKPSLSHLCLNLAMRAPSCSYKWVYNRRFRACSPPYLR